MFVVAMLFFAGAETYKFIKRAYFRRRAAKAGPAADMEADVEERVFQRYLTESSMSSGKEEKNEKV